KQLAQMMRGALAIGMNRKTALALALRCARDSMPQLRLAVLQDVADNDDSKIIDIRRRLQKPWRTVDRALQALHVLGLVTCREEEKKRGNKEIQVRHYSLHIDVDLDVLQEPQP